MSAPGGVEIGEVLRRLGADALVAELESADLGVRGDRCRCPFEGCADKGKDARRNVQIFREGKPHVFCFACNTKGDLVDVLEQTRRMTREEAIAYVRGQPAPARPPLQLVRSAAAEEKGKLRHEEVLRLWKGMLEADEECERYLDGRCLSGALALKLVRFASRAHPDKRVSWHAQRDYRVAMLLTDVVGNYRGIQMRLCRRAKDSKEDPWMSVKGSAPGRGFFGHPELIEASPIVCVAEGGADTLAVACWTQGEPNVAVVGIPGKDNGYKLAGELEAAGVGVAGKLFLLFTQNDRPLNKSRRSFERLRQLLVGRGARALHVRLHDEFKDVADWLQVNQAAEWPPDDVREAFAVGADEEGPGEQAAPRESPYLAVMPGGEPRFWEQNFDTLCHLLEEPSQRELVIGRRGELVRNEMTQRVMVGGREIQDEDVDVIRRRIERFAQATMTGKPLRFNGDDVARALKAVARERTVHPVREWLLSLKWGGAPLIDSQLPAALGQREGTFACTMLRKWLISTVARPLAPGCKVDTVLVLVGEQGIGKSSFFSALAGPQWFTDSPMEIGAKDGMMLLREAWIVELAELDAMRRARDKHAVRAWITSQVDRFREPYGKCMVRAPRGCVIVGSTNEAQFLQDQERRLLPIVVPRIDLAWVGAHREQLLAEAVHRYSAGEQWLFTQAEVAQLFALQEDHREIDPWVALIRTWMERRDVEDLMHPLVATQIAEVLEHAIFKPPGQWTQGRDANRVAECLRNLGWSGPRRRFEGKVGSWWFRPGYQPEEEEAAS